MWLVQHELLRQRGISDQNFCPEFAAASSWQQNCKQQLNSACNEVLPCFTLVTFKEEVKFAKV